MCWVMPPNSSSVTLAWRMVSKRLVLPWSTCPIMVMIGGRGFRSRGSSSTVSSRLASSTTASLVVLTSYSRATSSTSSSLSPSLMVTTLPIMKRTRMISEAFLLRRLANSPTVIPSKYVISVTFSGRGVKTGALLPPLLPPFLFLRLFGFLDIYNITSSFSFNIILANRESSILTATRLVFPIAWDNSAIVNEMTNWML